MGMRTQTRGVILLENLQLRAPLIFHWTPCYKVFPVLPAEYVKIV